MRSPADIRNFWLLLAAAGTVTNTHAAAVVGISHSSVVKVCVAGGMR